MGAFVISPLPPVLAKTCCAPRPLRSTGITPLHRYYGPNRHRLAVSRFPGVSGYTAYPVPAISRRGEDGFSSCSTCPCHRAAPTTPPECPAASVNPRQAMLPSPDTRELGPRSCFCRGHLWVHFRCGPVTRSPSRRWLCRSASSASFPPRTRPKLRGFWLLPLWDCLPLNMSAFHWTHSLPETPFVQVERS